MEYEEFKKRLKEIGLTVKEFSKIAKVGYGTCSSWSRENRKVPDWVDAFLNIYIENQEYKKYKESLQAIISVQNTKK